MRQHKDDESIAVSSWSGDEDLYKSWDQFKLWLYNTDVAHVPFSKDRFNRRQGFIDYSLNVAKSLLYLYNSEHFQSVNLWGMVFCGLTHALYKIGRYDYSFDSDDLVVNLSVKSQPLVIYGRNTSSLMILSRFFHLSYVEELAIRWCTGAWHVDKAD